MRLNFRELYSAHRLRHRNPTPIIDFFRLVESIPGEKQRLQKISMKNLADYLLADDKISKDTALKFKFKLNLEYLEDLLSLGVISNGVYQIRKIEINLRYNPSFKSTFSEIGRIAEELATYTDSP